MFAQKELQACSHMRAKSMLRLIEAVRTFDIGKVPAGPSEDERRKPLGAKWIDQQGPLNGKGSDSGGAHVGLAIVDGASHGEKLERGEPELSPAKPVRVSVFGVKIGRVITDGEQPKIHVIKNPFCRSLVGSTFIQHSNENNSESCEYYRSLLYSHCYPAFL